MVGMAGSGRAEQAAGHSEQLIMSTFTVGVGLWLTAVFCAFAAEPILELDTANATFGVDAKGALCGISAKVNSRNYVATGQPSPLLSVRVAGALHAPNRAEWDPSTQRLTLFYGALGQKAVLKAARKETHIVLELLEVLGTNRVELVVWGPYPTSIGNTIGETVGVVRDREFALGIQTLNAKTLGGFPEHENDIEPDYSADDRGEYELPAELSKGQGFRGDTARPKEYGSVLQAFCRNRDQDRIISNWGHEQFLAPAWNDGGVVGSKIALFACPAKEALATIGEIEKAEGLPHPLLDGVWGKISPTANCAYLIVDFEEKTIDQAIAMTKRAGLKYLYHSSPFETWGHFVLRRSAFPNGWNGLRDCVEKARKAGIRVGVHTLSNFTTPNDAYVTPVPDPRLARIGETTLATDLDEATNVVFIAAPHLFKKNTAMNTVVIGTELIRYATVSTNPPWRLLECKRGAWGTKAASHRQGASVAKLMDHDYNVFLTDADLSQEIARNIAKLCNETGIAQLSFDGLEGNWSTGMGQYGRTLFTKAWYDALKPDLQGRVINDASNPGHFNWHIYTRMNWGEPWYAGFRESQTLYRFKNQLYFERNLMPRMLGWFALRPDTSLEDAEWLLARAAGFDAGFALAASLASTAQLKADPSSAEAATQFGATPSILEAINQWEQARMSGAFSPEVKKALRDNNREFHLAKVADAKWELYEVHPQRFEHSLGGTNGAEFTLENREAAQPLQWTVTSASKEAVTGLRVEIDGAEIVALGEQAIPPQGKLKYVGGTTASLCDGAWKELIRVPVDADHARIQKGSSRVRIGSTPGGQGTLKVELRTLGQAQTISNR